MSVERMDGKMLDGVEKIFENMQTMMKKLKNVKNVHCRTWHMARKLKKHGNTHTHTHTHT